MSLDILQQRASLRDIQQLQPATNRQNREVAIQCLK